ncbi:MAG TPA: S1 RNA-binding domain-containing protein [Actinobacteria bacterium]|nr:S1 RNA-binding domain-containing protein [Actinomycetota bacterium]
MSNQEEKSSLEIGAIVPGKVVKITNFGAFLELDGKNSAMIHISEIDHSFVKDVRDFLEEEQVVDVKIISIKDDGKYAVSIKQATEPPARQKKSSYRRDPGFEKMLKRYMKSSDQRLADIKKNRMSKKP